MIFNENILLKEEIYALKHELARQYKALCECGEENARLKAEIAALKIEVTHLRAYAKASLHADRPDPILEMNKLHSYILQPAEKYSLIKKVGWRYEPTKLLTGESDD